MPFFAHPQRRTSRPIRSPEDALRTAFETVLDEGVPDRFQVLLDALNRKESDHDRLSDPPNPLPKG